MFVLHFLYKAAENQIWKSDRTKRTIFSVSVTRSLDIALAYVLQITWFGQIPQVLFKNKNDSIHKNEVQEIRWSDEYWKI